MSLLSTRRHFLATTSRTVVGTMFGAHALRAQRLPANSSRAGLTADAVFPDPIPPADLRALAKSAIDAAHSAGATYTDVRLAEYHRLALDLYSEGLDAGILMDSTLTYGVRVLVDGTWAFVHGSLPSVDAVTTAARNAVAMARGYAQCTTQRAELIPMTVAVGEWSTPILNDPFTIPIRDHAALMGAFDQAIRRVRYGSLSFTIDFNWIRESRVFASSEGALVTQTFWRSRPRICVQGNCLLGRVALRFPQAGAMSGGFETLTNPALQEELKRRTERVVQLAAIPRGTLDVGRYPVVFDGATLGMMVGRTLGSALELDRVLGEEADASGTSFLTPDLLGTSVASPLLTVTGNRAMPTVTAVGWDDEGVTPHEFTLIQAGRLMDYATSRSTASAMHSWYQRQSQPVRPHGCAVAPDASDPLLVRAPHLSVTPSTRSASLEDLCKGIKHGILVLDRAYVSTDQALTSGSFSGEGLPWGYDHGVMLEVVSGQIVRRIEGNDLQFSTRRLWSSQLVALGDTSTVQESTFEVEKGMPWRPTLQSTSVPAGIFREMNVGLTRRRV